MDGFLFIDKEEGWTSRDVCNKVQGLFHTKKVGHIGTLDPFATGLLIVSIGKATKAGQFLETSDKTYIATLRLGEARDGGDITGDIIEEKPVPIIIQYDINKVFRSFIGEYDQVPPIRSAVRYKGKRLYHYAYNNEHVTPPSRKVRINSLELISFKDNCITFICNVSKGTYIRTLGEDIAKKLGTVGYLVSLRRTAVSSLNVKEAIYVNNATEADIHSVSDTLVNLHHIYVDNVLAEKAKKGLPIFFKDENNYDIVLLVDESNNAIAVYERKDGALFKSVRGLF